jgi:hypothetical protein
MTTLEDSLTDFYKTTDTLSTSPKNCVPWYLHKWDECLFLHKILQLKIYSRFINNCQDFEAIKI